MEFRMIESVEDLQRAFPVMKELRERLDLTAFLDLYAEAKSQSGYELLGVFEGGPCVGVMGFRLLTDFVHGRHLYIDDLVVTGRLRSHGLGAHLLDKAKEIAGERNCKGLRLCTGIQNERGKLFYERCGWNLRAVVYKTVI